MAGGFGKLTELTPLFPSDWSLVYGRIIDGRVEVVDRLGSDGLFAMASVTKLFSAVAFHVAIEEEVLKPAEAILSNGATVAEILSHSSGLRADVIGPGDRNIPIRGPGVRRVYSNVGFDLLGSLLSGASGMDFGEYLTEAVLRPIHADSARLDPSTFPEAGPTGAAAGLWGTVSDLVALVCALISGPPLAEVSRVSLSTPHHPEIPGVLPGYGLMDPCPWGQGAEVRGNKSPHWTGTRNSPQTFGHFGRSGSFLWIDPVNQVFAGSLSSTAFGPWAVSLWPRLSDAILDHCGV